MRPNANACTCARDGNAGMCPRHTQADYDLYPRQKPTQVTNPADKCTCARDGHANMCPYHTQADYEKQRPHKSPNEIAPRHAHKYRTAILKITDILYPGGALNTDWGADQLAWIADEIDKLGLTPVAENPA